MAPDSLPPFDPEAKPPLFDDAVSSDDPNRNAFPSDLTVSGTEVALEEGLDVGGTLDEDVDPDERTDLEGPDTIEEDDGTVFHPSFGAGVGLNLGMGTGAGSEELDPAVYSRTEED